MRLVLLLAVIALLIWLVRRYFIARNQPRQLTDASDADRKDPANADDDDQRIDCPRCAERIRRQASVCRYCDHELTQ